MRFTLAMAILDLECSFLFFREIIRKPRSFCFGRHSEVPRFPAGPGISRGLFRTDPGSQCTCGLSGEARQYPLQHRNLDVTEVSPTRLSRPRPRAEYRYRSPKAIWRKAGQERHFRTARSADAGNAFRFPLRAVRHFADFGRRTGGKMSEVRLRTALLPPVYVLRYFQPLRMHPAHPRANPAQR